VQVKPGPQTQVDAVDFSFSGELGAPEPDKAMRELQDSLRRAWALPVGEAFSQSAWSSAKTSLLVRARLDGYPLARWEDTTAQVIVATNKATLSVKLDSGPLFHLGALRIEGLKYQSEQSVRRLAGFEPGEAYSERRLIEFQERLQKTLLFDSVAVELVAEADQAQAAPVRVLLREAPRQQATTAVGYSANTGQRVTLEHIHRIPFGLPIRSKEKLDYGRDLRSVSVELTSHPQANLSRNLAAVLIEEDLSGHQITTNLSARLGRLREDTNDERLSYIELRRGLAECAVDPPTARQRAAPDRRHARAAAGRWRTGRQQRGAERRVRQAAGQARLVQAAGRQLVRQCQA
jgi:translocation and assembly module TamA